MLPSPRDMDVDGAETLSEGEILARKTEIEKIQRVRMDTLKTRLVSFGIPWDAGPERCCYDFPNKNIEKDEVALTARKALFQKLREASESRKEGYHPPATSGQWSLMKKIFEIRLGEGGTDPLCFVRKPSFSSPKVPPKAVLFGPNFVMVPSGKYCSTAEECTSHGRFAIFCRPGLWIDTAVMPTDFSDLRFFVDWESQPNQKAQRDQSATFVLDLYQGEAIFVCNPLQRRSVDGGDQDTEMSVGSESAGGGGGSGSSSSSSSSSGSSSSISTDHAPVAFLQPGYDRPITYAKSPTFMQYEEQCRQTLLEEQHRQTQEPPEDKTEPMSYVSEVPGVGIVSEESAGSTVEGQQRITAAEIRETFGSSDEEELSSAAASSASAITRSSPRLQGKSLNYHESRNSKPKSSSSASPPTTEIKRPRVMKRSSPSDSDNGDGAEDQATAGAILAQLSHTTPGKLLLHEGYVVLPSEETCCPGMLYWSASREVFERRNFNSFVASNGNCKYPPLGYT